MFLLRLFGGASLEDESGPLSGRAVQRRRLALLAIIALEHPRAVSRDRLVAWLWPEHDTDRARHLLRDSLYLLRGILSEEALPGVGDELRLDPDLLRCDVCEFEAAIAQDRLEEAMDAYVGLLLDGFHVSGAPELEHWIDAHRERLARVRAKALEQLADRATALNDTRSAVEWWRRLAAAEPFNARVTLRLMEALAAAGDRAGAIQQARVHALLLEQEFEAAADPEVLALAERLRSSPSGPETEEKGGPDSAPLSTEPPATGLVPEAASSSAGDHPGISLPAATPQPRPRVPARALILASALLVVPAVLSTIWLRAAPNASPESVANGATAGPRSIAVLPCANLSGDPEQEHFTDGLTEELTGVLARVRSVRVAARTSAFAFKGARRDVREIGRALGVGSLLECSVRRDGDRTRVTAQLVNARNGFHLWAETYEREGTDVFDIQRDLALRIVDALRAELTPAERARIERRPTDSPEAHALYLKGRYFWNKRTRGDFLRAIEQFEHAIAIDPQYAQAHAGLAYVYSMLGLSGELSAGESSARTRDAALRAIELDPELAEAHTVLGGYQHAHAWDSEASERAHLRALELDPDYSTGHHWYGNFLASMERFDEAVAHKRKAVQLDPLTPHLSSSLGSTLLEAGRPREAFEAFRNAIELDSTFWSAWVGLGDYHAAANRIDEAVRSYRRAVRLSGGNTFARAALGRIMARSGRTGEARLLLHELQAEADSIGIYAPQVALLLVALDDVGGALSWLERSYRQKHPGLRFMTRPSDARLGQNPQYRDLRSRIGLPL